MKHIKLYESFQDMDSETSISNFKYLGGTPPKYIKIRFGGIYPTSDTFSGNWDITYDRILTIPIDVPTPKNLENHILQKLRSGKIHVSEDGRTDPYIGDCFNISNLQKIASGCESLDDFWDEVDDELLESGIAEYKNEYGADDYDPYNDSGENINLEAFYEIWNQYIRKKEPKFEIE